MRTWKALTASGLIAVLALTLQPGAATADPRAQAAIAPAQPGGEAYAVTLVTGDRVHVSKRRDGASAIQFQPGAGRTGTAFQTRISNGVVRVLPEDAASLVASGRLDARLFDVAGLARLGYDDARVTTLPLIVTYTGAGTSAAQGVASARRLPSINGEAVRETKSEAGQFWRWLTRAAGPGTRALAPGVARVWLDGRSKLADDESNTQIGVPAAWRAGFKGSGVTVAVLDSGYDAGHPDLTGQVTEAQDFTGNANGPADGHGHGTHVASIVAGTGTASAGRYAGVAPEAKLLVGKVCDDWGWCSDSDVISGMEWAAAKGARVANLSLGGDPSDGTDPVSTSLNHLTATAGTLFVVAAGNTGRPQTIGAPGSADAALTVGSVTKADALSDFSSQGPRLGDFAIKPDITAPGSDIVAARATGTEMGTPVDERYTRESGTSMATPHVAGVAALLSQAHPDWRADSLKTALTSSAAPATGLSVYAQGAGRVDAGRAVGQRVFAPGSANFGLLRWPYLDQPDVTKTVEYRNDGDTDVTLQLRLSGFGALRTGTPSIIVPARGTAKASVTLAPASGAPGSHGAQLTATSADGTAVVQTAIGVTFEAESYDLAVNVVNRDGAAAANDLDHAIDVIDTSANASTGVTLIDGKAIVRLTRGKYDVTGWVATATAGLPSQTLVHLPPFELNGDRAVTLDARTGRKLSFSTDRAVTAETRQFDLVLKATGGQAIQYIFGTFDDRDLYASPAVSDPSRLTFAVQGLLSQPNPPAPPAVSWAYNLAIPSAGAIPNNLTLRLRDRDLAAVESRYFAQGKPAQGSRTTLGNYGQPFVFSYFVDQPLPLRRTEYFSPGVDWARSMLQRPLGTPTRNFDGMIEGWYSRYEAGKTYRQDWNRPVYAPELNTPDYPINHVTRNGDTISAMVHVRAPNEPGHSTAGLFAAFYLTGRTTLSRDGTVIGISSFAGYGNFQVPPEPGRYELTIDAKHGTEWSELSTQVTTTWSFDSSHTAAPLALPLLTARPTGHLDDLGQAREHTVFPLDIRVQHQLHSTASKVEELTLQVSGDDGVTWEQGVVLGEANGRWIALVVNPRISTGTGYTSLRLTAKDAAGSTVQTTIIRGYRLTPR